MKSNKNFKNLKVINNMSFKDKRGYFKELLIEKKIKKKFPFLVMSYSKKNVIRGLHLQKKKSQGKFITVLKGKIFDVAVDLRKNSKTFGKHFKIILSEKNCRSIYIPPGFAHGFLVLTDHAEFVYKCTSYYAPEDEYTLAWSDPEVGIDWPGESLPPILSDKDKNAVSFKDCPAYP